MYSCGDKDTIGHDIVADNYFKFTIVRYFYDILKQEKNSVKNVKVKFIKITAGA